MGIAVGLKWAASLNDTKETAAGGELYQLAASKDR